MTGEELIPWAAGFLDGEGYFFTGRRGNRKSYRPGVDAAQVSRLPLDRLVELFGGAICLCNDARPTHSPFYKWALSGAGNMRIVLPQLIPYLTTKRREAEGVLALACAMPEVGVYNGVRPMPPSVRAQQDALAEAVVAMRRRAA